MRLGSRAAFNMSAAFLVAAFFVFSPQPAHARPIILENQNPSSAQILNGQIVDAALINAPAGPFAIYGTLEPGEELDAFEFVAPETGEIVIALLVNEDLAADDAHLSVVLASAEGTSTADETLPSWLPTGFDWESLDSLRGAAYGHFALQAGETYVIAVQPGTFTSKTLPYVLEIDRSGEMAAAPAVTAVENPPFTTSARLWFGVYGQREPRTALLVLAVFLALFVVLIVGSIFVLTLRGAWYRIRRPHVSEVAPNSTYTLDWTGDLTGDELVYEPAQESFPGEAPSAKTTTAPPEEIVTEPAIELPVETVTEPAVKLPSCDENPVISPVGPLSETPATTDPAPISPEPISQETTTPAMANTQVREETKTETAAEEEPAPDELEPEDSELEDAEVEDAEATLEWPTYSWFQRIVDTTRSKLNRFLDRSGIELPVSSGTRISAYLENGNGSKNTTDSTPEADLEDTEGRGD